jgi:hypothetical protein
MQASALWLGHCTEEIGKPQQLLPQPLLQAAVVEEEAGAVRMSARVSFLSGKRWL